jgi:NAD(P)-dependent dehydrogenase (short-subunit alcohol dehydrogenase family)
MKTVLITGANGGIGFACVKIFLASGYDVIAHYNKCNNNLIRLESKNLRLVEANFEELNQLQNIFSSYASQIDIIINNAGYLEAKHCIEEMQEEQFDKTLSINFKAPLKLIQLCYPYLKKKRWGRIINISSIGVKFHGSATTPDYTLTKHLLEELSSMFAKRGAEYNILVNTIRVGVTDTSLHKGRDVDMSSRIEMIPLKRMAYPEEIAKSIYYLASDSGDYITGTTLTVAGGE